MSKLSKKTKEIVQARANSICEYCRQLKKYSSASFSIDHIVPSILGGSDEIENLAYACGCCNGHKHDKISAFDPLSSQIVPLFNPRTQKWKEHFTWSDDKLLIIGSTPIGRATVIALHLNDICVVNLRRLIPPNEHPPYEE